MDSARRNERGKVGLESLIAFWLIRHRWWLLATAAVLALIAAVPAMRVTMDRRIERMFSPDDPLLLPHYQLQRIFGGNEIVLCVYDDPQLLNPDESGMRRLESIRRRLADVPGVKGVLSLEMPIGTKIVDDHYVSEQLRELFEGYTHGADGTTASIACMLRPPEDASTSRDATIRQLRRVMRDLPDGLAPGIITGEPVMMHDAFRFIDQDGDRLFFTTTILLGAVILFCFRSIRWVMIPILIVQFSLLVTRGMLGASRMQLTMVSSMLTAVVTVVGVATVIHLIVRYRNALADGMGPQRALAYSSSQLAKPIFWACVTDAVGFGSLLAANVAPVREFGLMMAIGSLMVLVSCALLIPALALMGKPRSIVADHASDRLINHQLSAMLTLVERHPGWVLAVMLIPSLVAMYGMRWQQVETDFTRNFRRSTDIVRSYELVESKLGGAGVFDIVLPAPGELNWKYLAKVLALEEALRSEIQVASAPGAIEPGLTKVLSLADAIERGAASDLRDMRRDRFRQRLINAGLKSMNESIPEFFAALYAPDPDHADNHYFRVMLRSRERQPSQQKQQIISQVQSITARYFPEGKVSGYFVLLTNLIDSILRDQWRTFAVALVAITAIMIVVVRSVPLALVAMVPNVIPILVVNGLMGWFGLKINMGAAMIAAVSMGLSIDSSIHYLVAFQRARQGGTSVRDALHSVHENVGRAMVLSTLALIVGFSCLATSQFIPTVYFGTLVSLLMLCTVIGTLLWLPIAVLWVVRDPPASRHYAPTAPHAVSGRES